MIKFILVYISPTFVYNTYTSVRDIVRNALKKSSHYDRKRDIKELKIACLLFSITQHQNKDDETV